MKKMSMNNSVKSGGFPGDLSHGFSGKSPDSD